MVEITGSTESERLRVPGWIMSVVGAAMLSLAAAAIHTWSTSNANADTIETHEKRLGTVEANIGQMQTDIAVIRQMVQDRHDSDQTLKQQISELLRIERSRGR